MRSVLGELRRLGCEVKPNPERSVGYLLKVHDDPVIEAVAEDLSIDNMRKAPGMIRVLLNWESINGRPIV